MAKVYELDVQVIGGFKNGSDEDKADAIATALRQYRRLAELRGFILHGDPHALPQINLLNKKKLDIIIRAVVKGRKKVKRKAPKVRKTVAQISLLENM